MVVWNIGPVYRTLYMSESVGFGFGLEGDVRICTDFVRPAIMAASAICR